MEPETTPKAMTYAQFLARKIDVAPLVGLDVQASQLSPALKYHQRDSVLWALRGGRRALFEAFGLGKTVMQLEWARIVAEETDGQVLIVAPLNVRREFYDDATHILHQQPPVYVKTQAEADAIKARVPIVITNYERVRDGDIDPRRFAGVTLDEAATLRSFGSKTYQVFLDKFKGVRYKLVNTATPSPNRYKELIHYAGFLEIMDTGQALTRWFKRDSTKANNLTLYPGREREFWIWCASWGLFLQKPSDLGYSDEGYSLPPLEVRYHRLQTDLADAGSEPNGQMKLMRDAAFGLRDAAREKRESIDARVADQREVAGELANITVEELKQIIDERNGMAEQLSLLQAEPAAEAESREVDMDALRAEALAQAKAELDAAHEADLARLREENAHALKQAERAAKEKAESAAARKLDKDRAAAQKEFEQKVEAARKEQEARDRDALDAARREAEEARAAAEETAKRLQLNASEEGIRFALLFEQLQTTAAQMLDIADSLQDAGRVDEAARLRKAMAGALQAMVEGMESEVQ